MPLNSKGEYHMNPQQGRASEGAKPEEKPMEHGGGEKTTTITHHEDGTHTSKTHDGVETEHPDHLHMGAHIMHHASGGEKHHITHHDGMGHRSHGIHEDGSHEETHDHANLEDVKSGLDQFFNEEGQEGESNEGEHESEPHIGGGY